MSNLKTDEPKGILREGWSATVDDYAIAGGWGHNGEVLVIGDVSGGVFAFEGTSGTSIWKHSQIHDGGLLSIDIHPNGEIFASSGQDGCVRIWNTKEGKVLQKIELGNFQV